MALKDRFSKKLIEKLKLVPRKPGVYLMKNKQGTIIYIGKSVNLKSRVSSYFLFNLKDYRRKTLVSKIDIFDYIITGTEHEALLLEDNLIKKHKPKYNVLLKDDKAYPFIQVTKEDFPRVLITRKLIKNSKKSFGPYTKVRYARAALKIIRKVFKIRDCKLDIHENEKARNRPCMNYQIGKCNAPCVGYISKKEYNDMIDDILHFLRGNDELIRSKLEKKMQEFSKELKFEQAAEIRDKLQILNRIYQQQTIYFKDKKDRDAIGIYKEDKMAAAAILKFKNGKLLNREIFPIKNVKKLSEEEILTAFFKQYYFPKKDDLPNEILIPAELQELDSIKTVLDTKVKIPQRGSKTKVMKMARDNAFSYVEEKKLLKAKKKKRTARPLVELKNKLNLNKLPRRIVCFDISNIQGTDTVSSAVFFENGKPKKKNYKKFKIRTVEGIDDFASMQETIERYLKNIHKGNFIKPDLFVIDGGKGQLSSVMKIMHDYEETDIEVISLAKRLEEVFIPGRSESVLLSKSSGAIKILINIRDEAHRFAITFHRQLRSKRTLNTKLTKVKGVGENTAWMLLKEFGSIKEIMKQKPYSLTIVKGIGLKRAKQIIKELKEMQADES